MDDRATALWQGGQAAIRARRLDAARADFEELLRLQPAHVPARLLLASVHLANGSVRDAARELLAEQWWSQAESRWRIIVISSFRGKELADAWSCVEQQAFREAMKSYRPTDGPREVDGEPVGILKLHSAIGGVPHGAYPIGEGARWGGDDGWLLWAADRIQVGGD